MNDRYPFRTVLLAGLIAGTLDATAAILLLANGKAAGVFKYIASGAFGPSAFTGGTDMVAWGVFFHYFIALSWAAVYFLAYPRLPFLQKSKWGSAVLYGVVVWSVMNLLVVPLTGISHGNFTPEGVFKNMLILIICIGLPVAWLAERART